MSKKTRSGLAAGVLLILIGGWFLALELFPGWGDWFWQTFDWPFLVIGVGVCLLIFGLAVGAPGMAVPAAIVAGIGGILAYQNATGDWVSWSYIWALIPGFVGVGVILAALLGEGGPQGFRSGLSLIFISAVLFLIFSSMMGANPLGEWWPVLLIILGGWLLIQPLFRRNKTV
ncbi:MAG TPA: hypothetical protein DEH22_18270 [Chloroflexi bacterium]|nr:hypothetical protein [Chloroflexota bacterium]